MEYLKEKVGQEFEGVISGVIESGIFVELVESRAEGMISFRTMGGGFYMTAPYTAGSRTGEMYTIGQPVKVRITRIDMSARQMDLALVDDEPLEQGAIKAPQKKKKQKGDHKGKARKAK
jgi:ribonuclease R